ncbi:hypothetical protein BC829DRAFT_420212 [Chytridium lagenaria]|nr:hypothetical protein BC829DRAFT_420212 [Chytridium lagenaria]
MVDKVDGEVATLDAYSEAAILRVPVLYGAVTEPSESAVNILVPSFRFPTNVSDVGKVIASMIQNHQSGKTLSGVYHFSATERMTKYGMCAIFADILGVSISHIERQSDPPKDALASRPTDAQLSTRRLQDAGIDVSHVNFLEWFSAYLQKA